MPDGTQGLLPGFGTDVNGVAIGGETVLLGDPDIRPEKPYTIVRFPGGNVEIARTSDGNYWIHVAVRGALGDKPGEIVNARIDFASRYGDEANALLRQEIARGDVEHIAFLVKPGVRDA